LIAVMVASRFSQLLFFHSFASSSALMILLKAAFL